MNTKSFEFDQRWCVASLRNLSFSLSLLLVVSETAVAMVKATLKRVSLTQGLAKGLEVQAVTWDHASLEKQEMKDHFSGTGPGACYNEAYRLLSREEARSLCSDHGTLESARCFTSAIQILPKANAIILCQGAVEQESPLECYRVAQRKIPVDQAVVLCSQGGNTQTLECFEGAAKTLSTQQALKLCAGPTAGARLRLSCFQEAIIRLGVELALDQCDHI